MCFISALTKDFELSTTKLYGRPFVWKASLSVARPMGTTAAQKVEVTTLHNTSLSRFDHLKCACAVMHVMRMASACACRRQATMGGNMLSNNCATTSADPENITSECGGCCKCAVMKTPCAYASPCRGRTHARSCCHELCLSVAATLVLAGARPCPRASVARTASDGDSIGRRIAAQAENTHQRDTTKQDSKRVSNSPEKQHQREDQLGLQHTHTHTREIRLTSPLPP